jgi:hypothetical protein
MTKTTDIPPALTAEQWRDEQYIRSPWFSVSIHISGDDERGIVTEDGGDSTGAYLPSDLHATLALANHALPDGDPRKITRAMVEEIESCVRFAASIVVHGDASPARAAVAALRALLPPE